MKEGVHRPLTMEAVHVHVPSTKEMADFEGIHAEEEADAWLRRHVLKGLAWEWVVEIRAQFEEDFAVEVDHCVQPHHTNGSVRDAVAAYFIGLSQDASLPGDLRTSAHVLAHGIQGEPLPVPVMRREWDLLTRETVLVPAPHQYHSQPADIQTPMDTHRPAEWTPEQT